MYNENRPGNILDNDKDERLVFKNNILQICITLYIPTHRQLEIIGCM